MLTAARCVTISSIQVSGCIQATSFNGGAKAFTLTVHEKANPPKEETK